MHHISYQIDYFGKIEDLEHHPDDGDEVEQVGDIAPPRHGLQLHDQRHGLHGNGEKQLAARRVSTRPMGRRHLKMYQTNE